VFNTGTGTLAPGDTLDFPFQVDSTTESVSFVVSWDTLPADVAVKIVSPSTTYEEDTTDPNVSVSKDESSLTVVVTGDAVEPGTWTVRTESLVDDGGALVNVDIQALSDSKDVTFTAQADAATYPYPTPMTVTATASFGPTLTRISMLGSVRRPDGSEAPIRLRDDGAGGDFFADDGIYTGRFEAWSQSGAYTVALDAVNDGSGRIVKGEVIHPSDPDPTPVARFARHTEFSVTASGVPFLQRFGMAVDKLKLSVTPPAKAAAVNQIAMKGTIDLDRSEVNPVADTLMMTVANLSYTFPPDMLTKVGKKDRYVFKDADEGVSGFVDLFRKGSSRGSFALKDKDFEAFSVPSLARVTVRFDWGSMDYSATVLPRVTKDTKGTFLGKKDKYETSEFFVSGAAVAVSAMKTGKDRLTFRAKVSTTVFDPLNQSTTITFGAWSVDLLPGDWVEDKRGRATHRAADKRVSIVYDPETQSLSVKAKKQDLALFTSPVIAELQSGFVTTRREIKPAEKVTPKKSSFKY